MRNKLLRTWADYSLCRRRSTVCVGLFPFNKIHIFSCHEMAPAASYEWSPASPTNWHGSLIMHRHYGSTTFGPKCSAKLGVKRRGSIHDLDAPTWELSNLPVPFYCLLFWSKRMRTLVLHVLFWKYYFLDKAVSINLNKIFTYYQCFINKSVIC